MEGFNPDLAKGSSRTDPLMEENKRLSAEVEKLRALLAEHNITQASADPKCPLKKSRVSLRMCKDSGKFGMEEKKGTVLPAEILLRILGFAVTSPTPIIDPFYKLRKSNITKEERTSRNHINVNFMATCKAMQVEGTKLIVQMNQFIFTQVAALEKFSHVSPALRANIEHLTIRCVGRYYADTTKKLNLDGDSIYHAKVPKFEIQSIARPKGMIRDGGIQAYCWYQVSDFLRALVLPYDKKNDVRPKLFPALQTFQLDLVNFCDHLPLGIWGFASILRWHLGQICDELLVTGMPEVDGGSDEEMLLRNILRDEGLLSTGCPVFISASNSLTRLEGYGYVQHVVRANKHSSLRNIKTAARVTHPEGGQPPKSTQPPGTTIWKYTSDHTSRPKIWIEFDRATGFPVDELNPDVDTYGEEYDSDADSLDAYLDDDYDDDGDVMEDVDMPPPIDQELDDVDEEMPALVDLDA